MPGLRGGTGACGQSPDTFAARSAPPGLVLRRPRGLFTAPALSLCAFDAGEKRAPCLVGEVRAARGLFRNDSANLQLLSFGSFANPALISDIFNRLLFLLMAEQNVQPVVVSSPGSQLAKGKRLFLLQITLRAPVSGVGGKCDSRPRDVVDTRQWEKSESPCISDGKRTLGRAAGPAQPSSPNTNNSPSPPRQKINPAFVLDKRRCLASFPSRFTCLSQICSCYAHG